MLGAGAGSTINMIKTLRNNRNLLRRKRMYDKERSFLSIKKEYLKAAEGKIDLKKASKEDLLNIRRKVLAARKRETLLTYSLLIIVICGMVYLVYQIPSWDKGPDQLEREIRLETEKSNRYIYLLTDGDQWLKKEKWHNAIFQYQKTLEIYPDNYDAVYRLTLAYIYCCLHENKDCELGKRSLKRLQNYFPETDHRELVEIYDNMELP